MTNVAINSNPPTLNLGYYTVTNYDVIKTDVYKTVSLSVWSVSIFSCKAEKICWYTFSEKSTFRVYSTRDFVIYVFNFIDSARPSTKNL